MSNTNIIWLSPHIGDGSQIGVTHEPHYDKVIYIEEQTRTKYVTNCVKVHLCVFLPNDLGLLSVEYNNDNAFYFPEEDESETINGTQYQKYEGFVELFSDEDVFSNPVQIFINCINRSDLTHATYILKIDLQKIAGRIVPQITEYDGESRIVVERNGANGLRVKAKMKYTKIVDNYDNYCEVEAQIFQLKSGERIPNGSTYVFASGNPSIDDNFDKTFNDVLDENTDYEIEIYVFDKYSQDETEYPLSYTQYVFKIESQQNEFHMAEGGGAVAIGKLIGNDEGFSVGYKSSFSRPVTFAGGVNLRPVIISGVVLDNYNKRLMDRIRFNKRRGANSIIINRSNAQQIPDSKVLVAGIGDGYGNFYYINLNFQGFKHIQNGEYIAEFKGSHFESYVLANGDPAVKFMNASITVGFVAGENYNILVKNSRQNSIQPLNDISFEGNLFYVGYKKEWYDDKYVATENDDDKFPMFNPNVPSITPDITSLELYTLDILF